MTRFSRRMFLTDRDVYQSFLNIITQQFQSEIDYLHLFDETSQNLQLTVWSEEVLRYCTTSHVSHYSLNEAGIWAESIRQKKVVVHNNYPNLPNRNELPEGHFPLRNHMSAPVWEDGHIVAVIGIGNHPVDYTSDDQAMFVRHIEQGWPAVLERIRANNRRLSSRAEMYNVKSVEETLVDILLAVGKALEIRDQYTSDHQQNVAYLAVAIATELELPELQVFGIKLGALLHDIGKINVPSSILLKTRGLLPAEYELMKLHPVFGADMFRNIDLPWPIVDMIEQHHERWDGSGYPYGLVGNSICLEARIIAVADTFDSMATDRPYRHAPGREAALTALKEGRGVGFDSYVIDAFFRLLEKDPQLQPGKLYT